MAHIIIKSNRVVTPDGIAKAFVVVKAGVITDVLPRMPDDMDVPVTDVGDYLLMPGVIDPSVHINEPGRAEWEGFRSATRAAIAGGITTIADMPLNASPVITTVTLMQRRAAAESRLLANCGFWGSVVPGNQHEIPGMIEHGVLGFKAFLIHPGIDEFPGVTEADLKKVMPVIAAHGLPLLVDCEMTSGEKPPVAGTALSDIDYLASKPCRWEEDAIAMIIRLCETYRCRVHIVHLSSAGALGMIARAKQKGLPLTVDTAQHYLYLNAEDIADGQTPFKCTPLFISDKDNNDLLWHGLQQGVIDFVATDHSPAPPELKSPGSVDLMHPWGGIASLQFALPALWTAARKRKVPFQDVVKWLCEYPARLTGMQNCKGKIKKDYDADLVVFDDTQSFTLTPFGIRHKQKMTPYLNEQLTGVVIQTYLGGIKVFEDTRYALPESESW